MTTYPLEYFITTVGTPHIKIVDWNFKDPDPLSSMHSFNAHSRDLFSAPTCSGNRKSLLDCADVDYVPLTVENSDDHLALTLEYGKVEDYQIGEEEAVELMREAREE